MATDEDKRSSTSVDQEHLTSLAMKRHKVDMIISTKQEKKETFGERIVALHQLVTPYGKTDTASVLLEAMEYIRFLQDQIKVLSSSFLQSTGAVDLQVQELEKYSLTRRGLCLAPVSFTLGVARSNGADIWTPIKVSSMKH